MPRKQNPAPHHYIQASVDKQKWWKPFNKRIKKKVLTQYMLFRTIFELNGKLVEFVYNYSQNKRLKKLHYKTPAEYLKETRGITLRRIVR